MVVNIQNRQILNFANTNGESFRQFNARQSYLLCGN